MSADLKTSTKKGKHAFSKEELLDFYEQMLLIRNFEQAVQENYKKGEIPGFIHLCIGQEAVAVGVGRQLLRSDWITSTHRGHGHALAKGVEVNTVMAELYGKATGCNGGRGGSMHLYSYQDGLFGTNGLVGGGIPLAVGLGMSASVRKNRGIAVAFFGDGAINHGTFHESLSLAAMLKTPVVFICENNLYATCTPYRSTANDVSIAEKAKAYGIRQVTVDGNDVMAVHLAAKEMIAHARSGHGPAFIEAVTYRTVGHHEGDTIAGTYRTLQEVETWKQKCPVLLFEQSVLENGTLLPAELDTVREKVTERIVGAVHFARSSGFPEPDSVTVHSFANPVNPPEALKDQPGGETVSLSWLAAVRDGIAEEMRRDTGIIYLGEGIGERGGTFGHTKNLWDEFGGDRVIDTPICELAFTGAAGAASSAGNRAIADLMFGDFVFEAASQIVNQISKLRYMSNGQIGMPVIIRAGAGQIKQAGPQHSGTFHSVWAHLPGLVVAIPSTPADAKGLMKTALRASDPVIFLEPKALLSSKGPVSREEEYIPFGRARIVETGSDVTIVAFGLPVLACSVAARKLREEGVSCEVVDLRTIVPLDKDAIVNSIVKTGRLLVVEEAYPTCSFSAEIIAQVCELAFDKLKTAPVRLNQAAVPQPFSPVLETEVGINALKVKDAVMAVINGKPYLPKPTIFSGLDIAKKSVLSDERVETSEPGDQAASPERKVPINAVAITIPNIGLTITEVTIAKWYKAAGDTVTKGEELLDFESDKSTIALEAETNGILSQIVSAENETVPIGAVVGYITPGE